MTIEQWRPIPGWEGYEVSSLGRVKSLPRVVERWSARCRTPVRLRLRGRTLKPHVRRDGYASVALCENGQPRTQLVCALVLSAFTGPRPDGMVACHNNGIRNDNRLSNLRWGICRRKRREAEVPRGDHAVISSAI
jgi:hypothetical protein